MITKLKTLIIGKAYSLYDQKIFHKLSLIAFFAWVGLGADGLSSSCYGPEEAFFVLGEHYYLGIFVGLAIVGTIFVISTSYSQIIELFPTGGGGYLVATKLLSPTFGMISGCALLIDYVLTITISIASGADALFSFLAPEAHYLKLEFAIMGVVILTLLNLRGIKESVAPLAPIFLTFIITHAFIILYAVTIHFIDLPEIAKTLTINVQDTHAKIGFSGILFLILRSYIMGAGTYTGIEAVSNGLPILREPKVQTAKRTMRYMSLSLAFTVIGLMLAYLLYKVELQPGKTLNAVLFERVTADWKSWGYNFVLVTLISEAALLFIAAQAGFLDGPRVLANMALDHWVPNKFATLSDRLVNQNGILIMGISALIMMVLTGGSVRFLVVLYSINVFITFTLSQLGMVRYWWSARSNAKQWYKKFFVNGIGLAMTAFILVAVTVIKFHEGGWITLLITGTLAVLAMSIKRHYNNTARLLSGLDNLVHAARFSTSRESTGLMQKPKPKKELDYSGKTAVLLVSGFNGLGLHTLFSVLRIFEKVFKNFIFIQVGIIDAGNFKGASEVERLEQHVKTEVEKYVNFMQEQGYYAEGLSSIGINVVDEIAETAPKILDRFPGAIFFGGQIVFPKDSLLSGWLHNYTVFAVQKRLYYQGIPVIIMPIRL